MGASEKGKTSMGSTELLKPNCKGLGDVIPTAQTEGQVSEPGLGHEFDTYVDPGSLKRYVSLYKKLHIFILEFYDIT